MKSFIAASALVATTFAATIEVTVGPGLSYSPDTVTANQGDIINFKFGSGHDIVSGSFDSPCSPDGKIYSGLPNDGDVFSVTVNGTDPTWIYCSVPGHCESGMAMVINPPSSGNTLDTYKNNAKSASSSSAPNDVVGGVFGGSSGSSASSSASSVRASATAAASSAVSSASSRASSATSAAASATGSSGAAPVKVGLAGAVGIVGMWALL